MLCIGRGYLKHVAKEAALKIKELSYIHAEGYSAAELKHGPLALVDKSVPTLALITSGPMEEKMLSNIREIKSRGGKVIGIVNSDVSKETKKVLDDISFAATDKSGEKIIINSEYVKKNLGELVNDTDLSKFIL